MPKEKSSSSGRRTRRVPKRVCEAGASSGVGSDMSKELPSFTKVLGVSEIQGKSRDCRLVSETRPKKISIP
jgi:hypothetical protein